MMLEPPPYRLPGPSYAKPLIDEQGEVRELTAADLKRMRPAALALPASLQAKLRTRGPQKAPIKQRIIIRLSPESASGA